MRVSVLNGSGHNDHTMDNIHDIIVDQLAVKKWDTTSFTLHQFNITYCRGCFACWIKTPGLCKFNDNGGQIAEAYIKSDLVIFFTPITFGGYSSELKKVLDRIICLIAPYFITINGETHHQQRYEKYPMLMGIGVLSQPESSSEQIFNTLISRNALNFHSPFHISGIISNNQDDDEKIKKIQSLLSAIEVAK